MSLNDIMNEENTITSNNSTKIMVDSKICVQDKKVDCLSTSLMDNEQSTIINKPIDVEDSSKVNITIKSCKNITSKQALLIIPITKFFSDKKELSYLVKDFLIIKYVKERTIIEIMSSAIK